MPLGQKHSPKSSAIVMGMSRRMSENESSSIMTIHTRMGEESGRREEEERERKRERNIGKEDVGKEREREREREIIPSF